MTGVRLIDRKASLPLPHVHASTSEWTLTSSHPVEAVPDDVDVLQEPLPGRLGWYVLPDDVVFALRGGTTLWEDFERVAREERLDVVERHRLNHLTAEEGEVIEEVEEVEEEEEDGEENESEEEGEESVCEEEDES